jgi:hypothetical protein
LDQKSQLKLRLEGIKATRADRLEMAGFLVDNPHFIAPLLDICLGCDDAGGSRACWVLEFVHEAKPGLLYPFLGEFTRGISRPVRDSSIRPLAKISEQLLKAFYANAPGDTRPPLTPEHKEALAEACFDWLLAPGQVAPKIYSMQSLLLLGKDFGWICVELRAILEQQYPNASPAYQARARRVLRGLKCP